MPLRSWILDCDRSKGRDYLEGERIHYFQIGQGDYLFEPRYVITLNQNMDISRIIVNALEDEEIWTELTHTQSRA